MRYQTTVSRRIDKMADDVREQLIQKIKGSDFVAIQFEASNLAQFSCFVRCISDGVIKDFSFASQYLVIQRGKACLICFLRL
jgi:hypothetical protein